jgi:hypothetical protein
MIRLINNVTNEDCLIDDIGICVPANGQYDFGVWDLDMVLKSNDLFKLIDEGIFTLEVENEVIVETAAEARLFFTPVTQMCLSDVALKRVEADNLSTMEEFIIANLLNVIFETHTEQLLLREYLRNVFVFFGKEQCLLDYVENIALLDGQARLAPRGETSVLYAHPSSIDDVTIWGNIHIVNCQSDAQGLQVNLVEGCVGETSIIFRPLDKVNWRQYEYLCCEIDGTPGVEVFLVVNNDIVPNSSVTLRDGRMTAYFDISKITRNKVKQIGLGVKILKAVLPVTFKVGTFVGIQKESTYDFGRIETITTTVHGEINELFIKLVGAVTQKFDDGHFIG